MTTRRRWTQQPFLRTLFKAKLSQERANEKKKDEEERGRIRLVRKRGEKKKRGGNGSLKKQASKGK